MYCRFVFPAPPQCPQGYRELPPFVRLWSDPKAVLQVRAKKRKEPTAEGFTRSLYLIFNIDDSYL